MVQLMALVQRVTSYADNQQMLVAICELSGASRPYTSLTDIAMHCTEEDARKIMQCMSTLPLSDAAPPSLEGRLTRDVIMRGA